MIVRNEGARKDFNFIKAFNDFKEGKRKLYISIISFFES